MNSNTNTTAAAVPATARTHKLSFNPMEPFSIDLVGAGGNGSQMLGGLARLNMALIALGYPGFEVQLYDPDIVTDANVGRQLFSPADVGQYKAVVLMHRINLFFGTDWVAMPEKYSRNSSRSRIVIGCVDTKAARRSIHAISQRMASYWLDLGNKTTDGQVVLGQPIGKGTHPHIREHRTAHPDRLPTVLELFPAMTRKNAKEDNTPSCSLAEALGRQDLFINQSLATFALNLLWQLLRNKEIDHHGYFVNLKSGRVAPLAIDPELWDRMAGIATKRRTVRKKMKRVHDKAVAEYRKARYWAGPAKKRKTGK